MKTSVNIQFNILVVDDEEEILRSLNRELRQEHYHVTSANSPFEALKILEKQAFQLIISDNRMPGMTGIELFEKAKELYPDTIRIMLTGYTDMEMAVKAINKGEIHRFVTKPWDREQLKGHIESALETYRLKAENKLLTQELIEKNEYLNENNRKLKTLATQDLMTGLLNHHEFQECVQREMISCKRYGHPFSLAMFDIDNFKKVNDTYGHPTGDVVIKTMATITKNSIRENIDLAFRYGGEEFAVLLKETDEENALVIMERIRAKIEETLIQDNGQKLKVTVSVGVGQYQNDTAKELFISSVDQALYEAKHSGKNKVVSVSQDKKD